MSVLVGLPAPDFTAPAVLGDGRLVDDFTLSDAIRDRVALLFFYPLDFSTVCPAELIALNEAMTAFREHEVTVIAVSIDSHFTHRAWRNTTVEEGGIGPVSYPMVADLDHAVCQSYQVQSEGGMAFRAAFLIDRYGTIRSQMVNDLPLTRRTDELLRLVHLLQQFEGKQSEVKQSETQAI